MAKEITHRFRRGRFMAVPGVAIAEGQGLLRPGTTLLMLAVLPLANALELLMQSNTKNNPLARETAHDRRRRYGIAAVLIAIGAAASILHTQAPQYDPFYGVARDAAERSICESQARRDGWERTVLEHARCARYAETTTVEE